MLFRQGAARFDTSLINHFRGIVPHVFGPASHFKRDFSGPPRDRELLVYV